MRTSPLALVMAMGTVLVATSLSLIVFMLLAPHVFAASQIVMAATFAGTGAAIMYFAAKLRHANSAIP